MSARPQLDPVPPAPEPASRPAQPPPRAPHAFPLVGPTILPYGKQRDDPATRLAFGPVVARRTPGSALAEHRADGPAWVCRRCGWPFPCPAWTEGPIDDGARATLLPEFVRMAQQAVRDLRGRSGGPTPPEIVRRFLWFLPLTDDEARVVALRVR
jgi:hypothetical protein